VSVSEDGQHVPPQVCHCGLECPWAVVGVGRPAFPPQELIEVATVPAPPEVAGRLGIEEGAPVVMRRLRFLVDDQPVQLVKVYYDPRLVAGSQLEQPVTIEDGVHAELRRLGVQVTRFIEDFQEPDSQMLTKREPWSFHTVYR
jgi:hypothetical protein